MKLKITGNGFADSDGDRMQIEIQYGDATFSLWFPDALLAEVTDQWDMAMMEGQAAIRADKEKTPPLPALEVPEA